MNVVYTEIMPRFGEMLTEQNIPHQYVETFDNTTVYYAEAGHLAAINVAKDGYVAWLAAVVAAETVFTNANASNLTNSSQWITDAGTDYADGATSKTASTTAQTAASGAVAATNTAQGVAQTDANSINVLTTLLTDANGFIKRTTQRQADALTRESAALTREAALLGRVVDLEERVRKLNTRCIGQLQLIRQLKGKTR